jgi:hypothetical protein
MATLQQMYTEERQQHGVREAIRRVAVRTGTEPASVARRLGFDPSRLPMGPVVTEPEPRLMAGSCNACADDGAGFVFTVRARGSNLRLCNGCAEELASALLRKLEAAR